MTIVSIKTSEKETVIALTEEEVEGTISKLPLTIAVAEKYSASRISKGVDIPFDLIDDKQLNAVLFVKENTYGKQTICVDVRKCYKKNDGSYIYTRNGVRISPHQDSLLEQALKKCRNKALEKIDESIHAVQTVQCFSIIRELSELHFITSRNCEGCSIKHPSQKQHMGEGGCLLDWDGIVDKYWTAAFGLLNAANIVKQADDILEDGVISSTTNECVLLEQNQLRERVKNM
jgi:hypothetical protein